jgi:hypothetical protein
VTTIEDLRCDGCGSAAAPDDVFCGECGNRIRGEAGRSMRDDVLPARRGPSGDPLPQPPDDLITRHLCATAHLDEEFADYVAGQLIDSQQRAVHPCPGVDLLAVARHAAAARTAARGRRFLVALIRIAALTTLIVLVAKGCSAPETSDYYSYSAAPDSGGPPLFVYLLALPAAVAVIAFTLFAFRLSAFSKAVDVMDPAKNPRLLAEAVNRWVEVRLDALDSSNVIVFSGLFSGINPFAGGGRQIDSWGITMDIAAARRDDDGELRRIEPFDAADLHDFLAREIPDITLPGLNKPRERLYVSGTSAPLVPGLVPRPRLSPQQKVPDSVLTNVLRNPTGYARTYLCFEKSAWGGQFVFSYLVRAEILQNKTLFVEGIALGMPPLTRRFLRGATIPADASAQIAPCLRDIAPELPTALFGGFLVRVVRSLRGRGSGSARRRPELGTDKDALVDYGSIDSIRTVTAADEIPWYFFTIDELMYLQVLNRRVMENTVAFLRAHGVDTFEFERQQTQIINKNHFGDISIGNVSGSGIVFGNTGQVNQVVDRQQGGGQR